MITLNVTQGTPEWLAVRLGIPTASNFDRIVTPKGALSASSEKYLNELVAEWFIGEPVTNQATEYMERGTTLEAEAVDWYQWDTQLSTSRIGFCTLDDGSAGCSPDLLVGGDGLAEIKCPSAPVHVGYLRGGIHDEYKCQTQGQLWITGRKWVDVMSFHPIMPKVRVRFDRDEEFIGKLAAAVAAFTVKLADAKAKLEPEWINRMEVVGATDDHPF